MINVEETENFEKKRKVSFALTVPRGLAIHSNQGIVSKTVEAHCLHKTIVFHISYEHYYFYLQIHVRLWYLLDLLIIHLRDACGSPFRACICGCLAHALPSRYSTLVTLHYMANNRRAARPSPAPSTEARFLARVGSAGWGWCTLPPMPLSSSPVAASVLGSAFPAR